MYFEKYHGTGNDFILIKNEVEDPAILASKICNRHFGIGADGLMFPSKSNIAAIKMNYYNSDGSIAKMCGNGIRCFAKFVFHHNLVDSSEFDIETLDGVKRVSIDGNSVSVKLNVPNINIKTDELSKEVNGLLPFDFNGVTGYILTVGTMHAVIYLDENPNIDPKQFKDDIQKHEIFLNQANVNFIKVLNEDTIYVETYERGAGWTLSCGTGATASAYHAFLHQKVEKKSIKVLVPGGNLHVLVENDHVYLIGPAEKIASGEF